METDGWQGFSGVKTVLSIELNILHWGPLELRIAEARGVRADVRRVGSLDFDIDTTFDEYTIYSLEHKAPSQHIVYTSQYQCPNCEVLAEG